MPSLRSGHYRCRAFSPLNPVEALVLASNYYIEYIEVCISCQAYLVVHLACYIVLASQVYKMIIRIYIYSPPHKGIEGLRQGCVVNRLYFVQTF